MTPDSGSQAPPPGVDVADAVGRQGRTSKHLDPERRPSYGTLAGGSAAFTVAAILIAVHSKTWSILDLRVYLWGGANTRRFGTPYDLTYLAHTLHFTYTPMAAGTFAVLSNFELPAVRWLIAAASVASLVVVIWLTWGKLGHKRSARRLGATLAVAALMLYIEPVQQTLAFGQVNLVLMAIVVADLCLPDRIWCKGVGVGLAAGFKLTPLIFIPYLLLTRRFRAAAVAAGTFALTIAGSFILLPKAAHQFWVGRLFLNSGRAGNLHYVGNQSLYGAALRLFGSPAAARPYWLAGVALVAVTGLLLAAWLSRRGQEMGGILTCALTGLLVSPVSWSHHWVWVAPAFVTAVDFGARRASRAGSWLERQAGWLGAATIAALFLAYPLPRGARASPRPDGLVWTVPAPGVQGSGMSGYQQLAGNLYVLIGLTALAGVLGSFVIERRAQQQVVGAHEGAGARAAGQMRPS